MRKQKDHFKKSEPAEEPKVDAAALRTEWAARYTKGKWYVLPVKDKIPFVDGGHTSGGYKNGSLDAAKHVWDYPATGVGVATGASKLVVVDPDSKEAHDVFLEMVGGDPQCNLVMRTPRGNWQYVYADPENKYASRNGWRTDIDIKAVGGLIVVPHGLPDRTWEKCVWPPTPPPDALAVLLPRVEAQGATPPQGAPAGLDILVRHGGTFVRTEGDNLLYRRPGKDKGHSASWNGHVCNVFTSNWPHLPEGAYNYAQLKRTLEGPRSKWRKDKVAAAWEDNDQEKFFELLAGASALLQGEYRAKWKFGLKLFDDALKEAKAELKDHAADREQSGPMLQKEYPTLLAGIERRIQLNECNQDIEINGAYWDERSWHVLMNDARIWAQERGRSVQGEHMLNAIYAAASSNAYNPLKEYLEGLPAGTVDGGEIDKIITCFPAEDEDDAANVAACIRSWLVGCVAHVYEPSYQNPMLVFQGRQNSGKSYFPKWLCSEMPLWFEQSSIDATDKDDHLKQSRAWIWEVEELEATTNKRATASLKSFITRAHTRLRAPYGKRDMVRTCIANYLGTLNPENFLIDDTGNRRFLVCNLADELNWSYAGVEVTNPDVETTPGKVWAEALAVYRAGKEGWMLTKEQTQIAEARATQSLDTSDVDSYLWRVVELTDSLEDASWLDDIAYEIRTQGIRVSSEDRLRKGICNALKKAGRVGQRRVRSKKEGGQGGKNKKRVFFGVRMISGLDYGGRLRSEGAEP